MIEYKFKGFKDYELNIYEWNEVKNAKAVVQIVHGMAEHCFRYDRFARFLNDNGYIVIGDDHRAHGKTSGNNLGQVPKGGDCFNNTVHDLIMITDFIKSKFNLPIIIFGHSYGSFLTQAYIQKASEKVIGAVICASARQDTILATMGRFITTLQLKLFGADKPAKLMNDLTFKPYNKKFKNEKNEFSWVTGDKSELQKYIDDEYCGQVMSIGFFHSFLHGLKKLYGAQNLASIRKDLSLFIVSGDCDPVGGDGKLVKKLYDTYAETAIQSVKLKLYPGGRHEILNEVNRDDVMDDILSFFEKTINAN